MTKLEIEKEQQNAKITAVEKSGGIRENERVAIYLSERSAMTIIQLNRNEAEQLGSFLLKAVSHMKK